VPELPEASTTSLPHRSAHAGHNGDISTMPLPQNNHSCRHIQALGTHGSVNWPLCGSGGASLFSDILVTQVHSWLQRSSEPTSLNLFSQFIRGRALNLPCRISKMVTPLAVAVALQLFLMATLIFEACPADLVKVLPGYGAPPSKHYPGFLDVSVYFSS
jgi:hypothetical protein